MTTALRKYVHALDTMNHMTESIDRPTYQRKAP